MEPMYDITNLPIQVGDHVAVVTKVYCSYVQQMGVVTGFTPARVKVLISDSSNPFRQPYSVLKHPNKIAIVSRSHNPGMI